MGKELINFICGSVLFILFFYFIEKNNTIKESFWSSNDTNQFINIQSKMNPDVSFNTDVIQNNASEEELNYFLNNNEWKWQKETEDIYKEAAGKNIFVNYDPELSLKQAKTIYNNSDMLYLLSQNTKEGNFLLRSGIEIHSENGSGKGIFGRTSGLDDQYERKFICGMNEDGNMNMKRIEYMGTDYKGFKKYDVFDQDYKVLDKSIPGFEYVNYKCDPCRAFNNTPNYSCPFKLKINEDKDISNVWKHLWGIKK
jgi:hypothetical protein